MAFNLPTQQNLHTSSSTNNRGTVGSVANLGTKSGGNLPISTNGAQVINNTGSNVSGNPAGVFFGMDGNASTSTYDASADARVLLWSIQFNAPNRIQSSTLANGGSRFWLGSGATPSQNYKEFIIGGNDTPFCASQAGSVTMCIDISDNSNDNVIGNFDPTQISAYGHGSVRVNLVGTASIQSFFQRSFLFTTTKGSSNLPTFTGVSNFDDAILAVQGADYTNKIGSWLTKSGASFFVPCPFSFGNGVDSISFNDNGVSVVSPASNSPNQENFRLTNDAMRIYLHTINGDSVVLSGSYSWGTAAAWDFNISNGSVCQLTGNFVGMGDFTLGSSVSASGNFNLSNGFSVISIGANINNINVTGDLKIQGNSITDFNGLNVSGKLDFDTAGTYNLNGCNIEEVTNSSGGNVIINSVNTVININNNPNTSINTSTAFALTGLEPNSEVRIFVAGTTTEITGIENSGVNFITTLSVSSIDLVILNLQYLAIKIKNIDTNSDVTLPIQQVFDRQYKND